MPEPTTPDTDRRNFIKVLGAASALNAVTIPHVHAQEGQANTLQVALVGCGGRGTGAAANALKVKNADTKLVAMADVFDERLKSSYAGLTNEFLEKPHKLSIPPEHQFVGFDAYKKAMDLLRPNDIVVLATPLAFRWVHYAYAIERGINVFMEKPVTADGPTSKRMLELAKKADEKGIKSAVGLMVRHCRGRQELHERISNGEIGDIIAMRAYRMHGPVGSAFSAKKPPEKQEVMYQIERFHSFLWASGGLFNDFYIHQIDETCWMKNAWPVKAHAVGGRHFRGDSVDQNLDSYAVEYTFDDGSKLFLNGRTMSGCRNDFSSIAHGSKGSAYVSTSGHSPGLVRTFNGQNQSRNDVSWAFPQPEDSPYQLEWDDFVDAIINNKPYNEVPRGVQASLVSSMGRMAAHTGQEITYEQMVECPHE
ncbi:MAG: Gfo/Idh/MocA family oxidoreductase, partial [Planctomycetota bacterium]|nr:Gfo/Idh/MocA family oxidoreductase [Planctomycetota bacterium]